MKSCCLFLLLVNIMSASGLSVEEMSSETGMGADIVVVTEPVGCDVNPRGGSWCYIEEVLKHAGVFYRRIAPPEVVNLSLRPKMLVLLAGDLDLTSGQQAALAGFVKKGGAIIGIGGMSGLDNVFGVRTVRPLTEGWIEVTAADHPITSNLQSSLHVFGGTAVTATLPAATSLAGINSGRQGAKGSAVVVNRYGEGRAVLLGPDLLFSIVHIQQGQPALHDAPPPCDGTAETNDGELKAEDGLVLDWKKDRTCMKPDGVPVFLQPISDELRALILRSIFFCAQEMQLTLPVLWYWPQALPAVGHISHDSDGHDPKKAEALLKVMDGIKVKSTWCILYPGGYPASFYKTLEEQGYEIALHYDARSGGAETSWSRENLLLQLRWLKEIAGLDHITSNKNHYTRWEGRLDFFRWCEDAGILLDQTRGPSKKGAIGFPLGGSQPYFPLDDGADPPRFLNVFEVNMLTQDLVVVCPREYGVQLVDSVLRQHGVAHFLFHPAHIEKPGVADALWGLVEYGRKKGMKWWTCAQIYRWEMLRRSVTARFSQSNELILRAEKPLKDATILFLRPRDGGSAIKIKGQRVKVVQHNWYGFPFEALIVDLKGEMKMQIR